MDSVESLIDHCAPVEEPDTKTPDDLLRLSVGLEHPNDIIKKFGIGVSLVSSSYKKQENLNTKNRKEV